MKNCSKCKKEDLPDDMFALVKSKNHGLVRDSWCKTCRNEYSKDRSRKATEGRQALKYGAKMVEEAAMVISKISPAKKSAILRENIKKFLLTMKYKMDVGQKTYISQTLKKYNLTPCVPIVRMVKLKDITIDDKIIDSYIDLYFTPKEVIGIKDTAKAIPDTQIADLMLFIKKEQKIFIDEVKIITNRFGLIGTAIKAIEENVRRIYTELGLKPQDEEDKAGS